MAKPQRDIRQLRPFLSMPKSGFVIKGRAIKYEKKVFHLQITIDFINFSNICSNVFELKNISSALAWLVTFSFQLENLKFTILARKSANKK